MLPSGSRITSELPRDSHQKVRGHNVLGPHVKYYADNMSVRVIGDEYVTGKTKQGDATPTVTESRSGSC